MSDFTPSDADENDSQESTGDIREIRRRFDDQARKLREIEDRAAAAERELAFAKAGLPLSDPKMGYFVKGYDGDLTPEAIKAAAEEAGFLTTTERPSVPPEELAAHQQAANFTAGGQPEGVFQGPVHENPQYQQEMQQAVTPEQAMAVMAKYGSPILSDLD